MPKTKTPQENWFIRAIENVRFYRSTRLIGLRGEEGERCLHCGHALDVFTSNMNIYTIIIILTHLVCYNDFNKVQFGTHIALRFHRLVVSCKPKKKKQQKTAPIFLGFLRTKVNAVGYVVLRAHFATN